jgi:hypothetical protein
MREPRGPITGARVVLLGWHGSKERQLRPLARWYEARGHVARVVLTPTFRVMSRAAGWPRFGVELAESLADDHARDPRPLVVHAFSNTGFWTLSAMLDAARDRHPALLEAHVATVLDSAPGFPERVDWRFSAKYAALAMTPGIAAALGLSRKGPRTFHPLVSPPLMVFLAGWHLVAREQVRFMESGHARVRTPHRGKPLLAIYSAADTLVPVRFVEQFLDQAAADGVAVERLRFEESAHVRHFVEHRHDYLAAIDRFLAGASARWIATR